MERDVAVKTELFELASALLIHEWGILSSAPF
jgi:hypothetical protein